jgi:DNA (cytosine-5)-methyltransferase 1
VRPASDLVLSLFPGLGFLDMAFEQEGFCVVRGPDLLWGGDVKHFHPPAGKFDGVIGGPPCQAHSRLVHLVRAQGHRVAPDLIPEFERIIHEARPAWWVMENVPAAPVLADAVGSALTRDAECGGVTSRERRWSWGGIHLLIPPPTRRTVAHRAVVRDPREIPVAIGGTGKRKPGVTGGTLPHVGKSLSIEDMLRRQGFPGDMLDGCPLIVTGKRDAIGNGVPLPMGRAIARAVVRATEGKK